MNRRLLSSRRISRAQAVSVVALVAVAGAYLVYRTHAATYTTEQARPADSLVDSVGVATHLTYTDTTYGNWPMVEQRLVEAGIRHIRDGWGTGSSYANDRVKEAATRVPGGLKLSAGHDARYTTQNGIAALKDWFKAQGMVPYLDYVEGPNEWDNYNLGGIRGYMQQMSDLYRNDPATSQLKILGPSFACQGCANNFQTVGDLTAFIDRGNAHDYPGGQMMSDSIMDMIKSNNAYVSGSKSLVSTETDYSTAVGATDCAHPCVPEDQAGVLGLRLYFEHFRRGWERSYKYEFVDQFPGLNFENRFGMLRNDFSPKPIFNAVKNTAALLTDLGPAFTPSSLTYSLTGADGNTRHVLLQKRDGSFWLAIWQQTEVWDRNQLRILNPADINITLDLATPASSITTYKPNLGQGVVTSGSGGSFGFASGSTLTLIRVGGSGTTATPAAQPDLIVTSAALEAPVSAGQEAVFTSTVKNQGTGATPSGTVLGVAFSVDGQLVNWSDTNTVGLAPGASVVLKANGGPLGKAGWTATAGTHSVQANVDDVNRIPESNETNNTTSGTFVVAATATATPSPATPAPATGLPDLVVSGLRTDPAAPGPGGEVRFTSTVTNRGTGATPAGVVIGIGFKIDGQLVAWSDTQSTSLAPGASVTLSSNSGPMAKGTWTATAGLHTTTAHVDDVNRIAESDETNNIQSGTMKVGLAGDLNGDAQVNVLDLSAQLSAWGTATTTADLNADGTVNILDLSILLAHWTG